MELSALTIVGARPLRAEPGMASTGGSGDLRSAWLSRLPSVEPGSMSEAYRSFRAEGQSATAARPSLPTPPPLEPARTTGQPAILSGTVPAALAAYGEAMEG
ncbi:MAG: hypothetical protein MEQ84_08350 [Mesorhizobium sp.]|nr:hypothetical protein [Mesorhizobium sp.]